MRGVLRFRRVRQVLHECLDGGRELRGRRAFEGVRGELEPTERAGRPGGRADETVRRGQDCWSGVETGTVVADGAHGGPRVGCAGRD